MAGGCIDIKLGRRGDYDLCKYWVRDESDEDLSEFVRKTTPSGRFYCHEVTAEILQKNQLNNLFMFDASSITIRTRAAIKIKQGDAVQYNDDIWIVKDVQFVPVHKNNQFMKNPSGFTYIQLQK